MNLTHPPFKKCDEYYAAYCRSACKWCAESTIVQTRGFNAKLEFWHYDELGNAVERCTALGLTEWTIQLVEAIRQVDDVLVVNWIVAKDNDYRKALADLVTQEIQMHNDPVLNPKIVGVAIRHRETGAVFAITRPARHDTAIRELLALGKEAFAKGEQGFVTSEGDFLTREEAWLLARKTGQFRGEILFSEDLW